MRFIKLRALQPENIGFHINPETVSIVRPAEDENQCVIVFSSGSQTHSWLLDHTEQDVVNALKDG